MRVLPTIPCPVGRVALHETAEQALLRELRKELGIDAALTILTEDR